MANKKTNNVRSKSSRSNNARTCSNSCKSRTSKNNELSNMKYEIAKEFGVNLGANSSARANGSVGGEMTKRLIEKGRNSRSNNKK